MKSLINVKVRRKIFSSTILIHNYVALRDQEEKFKLHAALEKHLSRHPQPKYQWKKTRKKVNFVSKTYRLAAFQSIEFHLNL